MKPTWGIRTVVVVVLLNITLTSASQVSVLTYNMQGMMPGSDPETRIQHIIDNLRHLDPDIIGLQEINETPDGQYNQAQIIADSLASYFGNEYHVYMAFTHYSWDNQFKELIGIISKFPVLEQGFGQLVTGVFPRKIVWNAIDTPVGRLNLFNTHLSFNSPDVRVLQVQQIIGFITHTESLSPGAASILVGDFNDEPDSETIRLLTEPGTETFYIDTYAFSNPTLPGYTIPANSPTSRIDFIFEKSTGDLRIDTSLVVINETYDGVNYCSDHLGVLTIFRRILTGSQNRPQKPTFRLLHPQPNPSTGRVLIPYVLNRDSTVSLTIHNIMGQRVKTLLGEVQSAGSQQATWDCRDAHGFIVPSATYVVRLEVDGVVMDDQMTVIR